EIDHAVEIGEIGRLGRSGAWVDVIDQLGGDPVRLPQFKTIHAVGGVEIQFAVDVRQVEGGGTCGSGIDVRDNRRSSGSGRLPQLGAIRAVVGFEKERVVDVRQIRGGGAGRARVDVCDHHGSGLGPVRLPQLRAMRAVVGLEV